LFGYSRLSREVVRMPLEGQHLGHYRLLRLLGSGGMGDVYLAEDDRIGQQVAIKVIRSEGIAYPQSESAKEAARLFEREAKAIARLDHPNILPLYAYGEETLNDTPLTYLVMPYRKEGTLATWLRQRGRGAPLSPAEVTPLLQQAAEALQYAHDQHVLHQDIKPSNFLIRLRSDQPERPDLLLADFGIAKLTSATASASQSIRGTPTYMAPEQWDGHPVAASDQYALAIMVYELLVGRTPFVGNPGQVMRQHYLTLPPAPSSLGGHLLPAIDVVLLRALAKEPGERFASVSAFAQAFQEAVQSEGELHATLAISRAEAESGTTRSLTLPGGRQVSVPVPAGIGHGAILRLEGQGMPYYEGGPAGPLVLTIAIPAQASPQPLPKDSTEPTVAVSTPKAELLSVEDLSVPPARTGASGDQELTSPASHASETASTVLATDATSLPTEKATPLPAGLARSAIPPAIRPEAVKPAKPNASRRIVLLGLAGLVIVALASSIVWFTTHQASLAGSITVFPVPTASNYPAGITAGPDGNLWFTEVGSQKSEGKIGRISPSGTITEFPVPTASSSPLAIAKGPDGNLWFTDEASNKIGRISPSGTITEFSVPTAFSIPAGITAGPDGNLWFTEEASSKIGRISPSGTITEFSVPTAFSSPLGIAKGPDGNLWFTERVYKEISNNQPNEIISSKIGRISPSGTITEFPVPTASSGPYGIAAGPDSNLWFTEDNGNQIGHITTSGTIVEFPLPTSCSSSTTSGCEPSGITAGPDGNLWFTERFGNQIGRITTSGTITEFPVPLSGSPWGITAGPDDNLWFTDGTGDNIERITSGK
jgi:eukaryotic-like serine/threonine-protein kinase